MASSAVSLSNIQDALAGASPGSQLYKELMGVVNNPSVLNNPALNASISGALQYPAMPDVTGTLPTGQQATVPYNAPPPADVSNLQLNSTGAPGMLAGAPAGSAATTATPNLVTALQTAASGSSPSASTSVGTPPGGTTLDAGTARTATPSGGISLPGGLGSINTGALLPALFSTGLGLWGMLGSQGAYNDAGNVVNNAETAAGNEVNTAAQGAASGVTGATSTGNALLDQLLHYYNGQTAPYQAAGATAADELNTGIQPGGALNTNLTADEVLKNDPGYQFRLGQGLQGVQAKLAAEGLSDSGAVAKELTQYGQDYASNEFQNAYQRNQENQQNLFSRLAGAAGIGQTGVGQGLTSGEAFGAPQASNTINAANSAGGFNLAGSQYEGNAKATGAGAVAGGKILGAQSQQNFIQQLLAMIPMLFSQGGGSSSIPNPFGLTGSDNPLPSLA